MSRLILILSLIIYSHSVSAYIDTTSKSFKKPEPIEAHAYEYKESRLDRYINVAADKLGGSVLGTVVTGPVGLMMKISDKVFKNEEEKESSQVNN